MSTTGPGSPALALALLSSFLIGACRADLSTTDPAAPRLALEPCNLRGVSAQTRCGTLEVYEDRAAAQGRKIKLYVAVIPALASSPEPDPLFLLAGGPGQAATQMMDGFFPAFDRIHQKRDLVLVDQRGTGRSNPLECELFPKDAGLPQQIAEDVGPERWKECLAKLDADPRFYTTPIAMQDLDDVRAALGYPKINLWGGSYGTRAALVYMRAYPDRVRTAILDGVAPMSLVLPLYFARDSQRALDLMFEHCAADAACVRAYPDLEPRFTRFLERLAREPMRTRAKDPLTGVDEEVTLTRDIFTQALRSILYQPELTSMIPWIIHRAEGGDLGPLLASAQLILDGMEMSEGMFASVACSEDVDLLVDEDVARLTAGTWGGDSMVRYARNMCVHWPKGQVAADYRTPVASTVPVLLLSGDLDPVTPPSWAEDAQRTLPSSLSVVLPGAGHITAGFGCVQRLMSELLERGTVEGLDGSCGKGLVRPPFFLSFAGPKP